MLALIKKEFSLALHPTVFIFLSFAAMLLIPSYPYYVAFYYTCLSIFFVFITGRETKDTYFTVLLPVRKCDCVRARLIVIAIIQLMQIAVSIPFAFLTAKINPNAAGNPVGIEADVAFYGLVLVMYSIFNLCFVPWFYKNAYDIGKPFLVSSILMFLFMGVVEAIIHIFPELAAIIDTTDAQMQLKQLPILLGGALIYAFSMLVTWKVSAKRFESVDL